MRGANSLERLECKAHRTIEQTEVKVCMPEPLIEQPRVNIASIYFLHRSGSSPSILLSHSDRRLTDQHLGTKDKLPHHFPLIHDQCRICMIPCSSATSSQHISTHLVDPSRHQGLDPQLVCQLAQSSRSVDRQEHQTKVIAHQLCMAKQMPRQSGICFAQLFPPGSHLSCHSVLPSPS